MLDGVVIEVGLRRGGDGGVVVGQPGQEPGRGHDRAAGPADRAVGCDACLLLVAEPAQQVPPGKLARPRSRSPTHRSVTRTSPEEVRAQHVAHTSAPPARPNRPRRAPAPRCTGTVRGSVAAGRRRAARTGGGGRRGWRAQAAGERRRVVRGRLNLTRASALSEEPKCVWRADSSENRLSRRPRRLVEESARGGVGLRCERRSQIASIPARRRAGRPRRDKRSSTTCASTVTDHPVLVRN